MDDQQNVPTSPERKTGFEDVQNGRPQTYGEKAVGLSFNPSKDSEVDFVKQECAKLIDSMNALRLRSDSPEQKRLASIAITELQGAQMWAVKALTWKD